MKVDTDRIYLVLRSNFDIHTLLIVSLSNGNILGSIKRTNFEDEQQNDTNLLKDVAVIDLLFFESDPNHFYLAISTKECILKIIQFDKHSMKPNKVCLSLEFRNYQGLN